MWRIHYRARKAACHRSKKHTTPAVVFLLRCAQTKKHLHHCRCFFCQMGVEAWFTQDCET
jgi:hypothetical protein